MTAPNPRQFERACDQTAARIRQRLADLPALYDHAHGASHERVARGSTGKITHGTNDPTAAIVGDPLDPKRPGAQAAIRRVLERAPARLTEAENILSAIEREILRAMDRLDPGEDFEPLRYPISITQADLAEAKEAQERRKQGIA